MRHAAKLDQHAINTRDPAPTPVSGEIFNIFNSLSEKRQNPTSGAAPLYPVNS
jgi:hypothetical protein